MSEADTSATTRPYGIVGLVIGTFLILLAALLALLVAVALGFAAACAVLGLQEVRDRLADLTYTGKFEPGGVAEKVMIALSLVVYPAISLAVVAAARVRGGAAGWRDIIAWRPWNPFRRVALWVWGIAALMLVYSFGADALVTHLAPQLRDLVQMPPGAKWIAAFIVVAVILGPLAEELFFRGWLYTSFRASFGVTAAVLASSLLFAIAHWESTHLYAAAVFPVGLGLCWIRERTGSIVASTFVHGLYNGVMSILLLFSR